MPQNTEAQRIHDKIFYLVSAEYGNTEFRHRNLEVWANEDGTTPSAICDRLVSLSYQKDAVPKPDTTANFYGESIENMPVVSADSLEKLAKLFKRLENKQTKFAGIMSGQDILVQRLYALTMIGAKEVVAVDDGYQLRAHVSSAVEDVINAKQAQKVIA